MKANPGGYIDPAEAVGRDDLIRRIWSILQSQSVQLTSERRIGKTTIINKMNAEPAGDCVCFKQDLEGLRTVPEFVEAVYGISKSQLGISERFANGFHQLLAKLKGAEISDIKLPDVARHWKVLLETLVDDLCRDESRRLVYFWDELPLFVDKVRQGGGEREAMDFLDVLRSLRQKHPNLRMVYTGSIGLHCVLSSLRKSGYANAPTNDMQVVEVPPLEAASASALARQLIQGEDLRCADPVDAVAEGIAEAAGGVPFYVHWIVSRLTQSAGDLTAADADRVIAALIADPQDPANFRHYRNRLKTYYAADEVAAAFAVLDELARNEPVNLADLSKRLMLAPDGLREVTGLLAQDHYVTRGESGYRFRYPIVRRWWKWESGS